MASTKEKMQQARQLIQAKRYDEARAILRTVDHDKAYEWLDKLDKIAPVQSIKAKVKARKSWKRMVLEVSVGFFVFLCLCSFIAALGGDDSSELVIPTTAALASITDSPISATPEPTVESIDTDGTEVFAATTDTFTAQDVVSATTDNQAALAPIFASATAAMLQAQSIRPTVRPSASPFIPTALPTTRPLGMTMYINDSGVRARACPRTDCEIITTLSRGDAITVYGTTEGMNVSGNSLWYEVDYGGQSVFVYSAFVQQYQPSEPVVRPVVSGSTSGQTSSSVGTGVQSNSVRPANCTEAVAMGLTAQQAAQWSHLDRDNDGVACYGD